MKVRSTGRADVYSHVLRVVRDAGRRASISWSERAGDPHTAHEEPPPRGGKFRNSYRPHWRRWLVRAIARCGGQALRRRGEFEGGPGGGVVGSVRKRAAQSSRTNLGSGCGHCARPTSGAAWFAIRRHRRQRKRCRIPWGVLPLSILANRCTSLMGEIVRSCFTMHCAWRGLNLVKHVR